MTDADDQFAEFPFSNAYKIHTPVLSMQEIFIFEKGKEAMRSLNIKLIY